MSICDFGYNYVKNIFIYHKMDITKEYLQKIWLDNTNREHFNRIWIL